MIGALGYAFLGSALGLVLLSTVRRHRRLIRESERAWASRVRDGLAREFVFIDPDRLRRSTRRGLLATGALTMLLLSPVPLILGVLLSYGGPRLFITVLSRQRRKKFDRQFADSLPQISSVLHAGHTFERALESLSRNHPPPLSEELAIVLKEIRLGSDLKAALSNLLRRFPSKELEIALRAVCLSRRTGSNLAEAFDRVSDTIRTRRVLKDQLAALTAAARIQANAAIAMPIVLTVTLSFIAPGYLDPMFDTDTGRAAVLICAVMLAAGGVWVHRIGRMELIR